MNRVRTRVRAARALSLALGCVAALPSIALAAESAPAAIGEPATANGAAAPAATELPDLGTIRYRDPTTRRALWLGVDAGGVYLPASLGVFSRTVWTAHTAGAWALAITPWLAAGGRHALVWYDATNVRLRMHHHELELSGRPTAVLNTPRMFDRLALGVEFHTLRKSIIDGEDFFIGGIKDVVVRLGYGIEHVLHPRWRLGWNVQGRYASVFRDSQRHLRAGARVTFLPRPQHGLGLEAVAFMVHRDADQFGTPFPRLTGHGQFALQYDWLGRRGVGLMVRARYTTGFLSGEAPVYELREESLTASYAELVLGVRAVWR